MRQDCCREYDKSQRSRESAIAAFDHAWCSPWRARASGIRQEFYASSSVFARSISCACCRTSDMRAGVHRSMKCVKTAAASTTNRKDPASLPSLRLSAATVGELRFSRELF
jgi:hypothetical protein